LILSYLRIWGLPFSFSKIAFEKVIIIIKTERKNEKKAHPSLTEYRFRSATIVNLSERFES